MSIIIQRNYINCKIDGNLPDNVFRQLREEMRYPVPGYRFSYVYKRGWGDGYVYLITPKRRIFPSGLLYVVENIFKQYNIDYTIKDLRTIPIATNPMSLVGKSLRDYQVDAEQKCLEYKCGVIKMPTGAGKTLVFTSLLGKLNGLKRVVYVRKLDLMEQTIRCLSEDLGLEREEIGEIGGGKVRIKDLSVVMIPTAARALGEKYIKYTEHDNDDEDDNTLLDTDQKLAIKEFIENTDCFIMDECFSAGTIISTESGLRTIEDLVETKYAGNVWSYNTKEHKMELCPVTNWYKRWTKTSLCRINLCIGSRKDTVVCTENHKFYTIGGSLIKAKDLQQGDVVYAFSNKGKRLLKSTQQYGQAVLHVVSSVEKNVTHETDNDDQHCVYNITVDINHNYIANGFLVSNCHALSSETAQMVSKYSKKAYYRIGCSATPWRTDGTDILINAATGPRIVDITASTLIERGFLVPPRIHFYKMKHSLHKKVPGDYQRVYTDYIVENKERNEKIVKLVDYMVEKGERPVILVQRQQHGKMLEEMFIKKGRLVKFIYGESCMTDRAFAIDQFKAGVLDVLIGSSLPWEEKILIKDNLNFVKLISIGSFVDQFLQEPGSLGISNNYQVLTVDDNHRCCWKYITAVHKHLNVHDIIEATSEGGMTSLVTSNHSMIGPKFEKVEPQVANKILAIGQVPLDSEQSEIDIVKCLIENVPPKLLERLVVKIDGITQAKVREMKTDKRFYDNNGMLPNKGTLKRVVQRLQIRGDDYRKFLQWYFREVSYKRGAKGSGDYVCSVNSLKNLEFNLLKFVNAKIVNKRGKQHLSLPLALPVTDELIKLCGYFVSEGSSNMYQRRRGYFAGSIHWAADVKSIHHSSQERDDIGKQYKRGIREDIIECCKKVFGVEPNQTCKGIKYDSFLYYIFWRYVVNCGGKSYTKRVPDLIYNVSESKRKTFLLAYFRGDGHLDIQTLRSGWQTQRITLTSNSRDLVIGLLYLLRSVGYKYVSIRRSNKDEINKKTYTIKKLTHDLYTVIVHYCNFCDQFQLSPNLAKRGYYHQTISDTHPVKIEKIQSNAMQTYVYDISVQDTERFVGGMGHVLHNSILNEGLDIKCITALVNAAGGKSSSSYYQKIGRAIRVDEKNQAKTRAVVIDFIDEVKYLNKHSKERIRVLKSEPLYEVKVQD